jgi:hypothetical protein
MKIIIFFKEPVHPDYKIQTIKTIRSIVGTDYRYTKNCVEGNQRIEIEVTPGMLVRDTHQVSIELIRSKGGTVIIPGNEWSKYIDSIREILFAAKMANDMQVIYTLEKIINVHEETEAFYENQNRI